MKRIIFDIETTRCNMRDLPDSQQEFLLREAEKEVYEPLRLKKVEEAEKNLSLFPFTAKLIAIGYYDVQKSNAYVMYESEVEEEKWESESGIIYKGMPEKEMLLHFWQYVAKFDQVITFNGRNFDIPFLMLRSAILEIKPTRNLMGNRYNTENHLDLLDALSFFGVFKKFNLDFYCHSFGVESPKSKGITGMDVHELYIAGKIKEIATYCAGDVEATFKLYKIWDSYLNV
jgi:DNA polymerase elongation subunit (family B)